ncbi:MAG: Asp-tRNA(Asn)/Glu-tRNA(Gln) amidotransferase subunit GatB [Bdellovibrionaceae bacterium]|nr:Asp-tRNA(Asn)/Glu-tRNA(Gln) amidotransferase subunit GatB [Pseudobdellovibrionaceae bacterium]
MSFDHFDAVIGLEIHAQLLTESKIFCRDSTHFGAGDNENICPVCTGMPGSLPVLNRQAVEFSIKTGLALNCDIRRQSVFARKQYFYPDLPKGYQISQYDRPLCENGHVDFLVDGQMRRVSIVRAHMEEDAGKSTHHGDYSLINLNRAGIPLLEIVSGPDLRSAREAAEYARAVRNILRYLGVCDGNLEEGSLRCDVNVSVRPKGQKELGTKVEIKNINSFRFIEKAIEYEIHRQIDCVLNREAIVQETRLYDADKNRTFTMRTKEDAHDYRYFPDPDLLPLTVEEAWIERMRATLPELPLAMATRFVRDFQLPEYDAFLLTQERELADYFERTNRACGNPKAASNWVMTEVLRNLNETGKTILEVPVPAEHLGRMIRMIDTGVISGKIAKTVFGEMWTSGQEPDAIVKDKGLVQITDVASLERVIDQTLAENAANLEAYRSGKDKLFGFFVGQVMKATKGQASPEVVNELLKKKMQR